MSSSVTTFKRPSKTNANNSIREEESTSKGSFDSDRQQKPQFRDERFRRMELMIEFTNLRNPKHCPSGVYVMPSAEFYVWYGVVFVHKGYYKGGIFQFKIDIPKDYPDIAPVIVFPSSTINNQGLFHPLVHPETGEFSLTQQFKDWAPHKYYIFHILHYIKKSFKKSVLDNLLEQDCLGVDAYKFYNKDIKTFTKMASQSAKFSRSDTVLFDNNSDANPIQFSHLGPEKLDELKTFMNPPKVEKEKERPSFFFLAEHFLHPLCLLF